jgi:hypothetical protein
MKTIFTPQLGSTLAGLALLSACADQGALDVGSETAPLGQALSDYAAHWDGYAEAFAFSGDGTDRVRLTLDETGAGVLRVGQETLFPPATDPTGFYPPTFDSPDAPFSTEFFTASLMGLRSGFEFAVSQASVSDRRLKFQVALGQIMDSWCMLQAPEPVPGFQCGGGGGFSAGSTTCFAPDGQTPVDCNVASQCASCVCDAQSCRAASPDRNQVEVDAALDEAGDTLEGTLLTDQKRVTIRMTR